MQFTRERLTSVLRSELLPLFEKHHKEVSHYKDIPISPRWGMYQQADDGGSLRIYTARVDGKLVGYNVYFITAHPHSIGSTQALQDIVYIEPEHRGGKGEILKWCESELQKEGVSVILLTAKLITNVGELFEKLGYEPVDITYMKRLRSLEEKKVCQQ